MRFGSTRIQPIVLIVIGSSFRKAPRLHKRDTVKAKRAINTANAKKPITELHCWPFTVDQLTWYIHEKRVRFTAKQLAWYIPKMLVVLLL